MTGNLSKIKNHLAAIAIFITIGIYFIQIMNVQYWNRGRGIIFWDTISYYAYLPATFIYHDLSLKFIKKDPKLFEKKIWPEKLPNGNYAIKTTMGLAFAYSPFFLFAEIFAHFSGKYPADGYSLPYHIALEFSSLFYLIFGLLFLRKILRKNFSESITAITILVIGLATNLFYYTTASATMPHSFEFTLIVLFIWSTIKWYEKKRFGYACILGLLAGIISLIRPTDAIVVLLFLLYDIRSMKERFSTFLSFKWQIVAMIFFGILVWIPQLFYWKWISGNWFLFSYGSDERFFWTQPELFNVLLGFRKGWFIYTPVMIFGAAGIFMLRNKAREWAVGIPVTIIFSIYIISSWWCWWYGGGFGMRPMIDFYGLMAIGIAAFLSVLKPILSSKRYILIGFFSISIFLGLYHHIQYYYGAIHWDSMTWGAYKHSFGKVHVYPGMEKYLNHPDYEEAKNKRE